MSDVINYYEVMPKHFLQSANNQNYKLHKLKIPMRVVVLGPSGSGKSNFILNLLRLFCKGKGTFTDIYIITRNKDEPLYNYLNDKSNGNIGIKEGLQSLPELDKFDKNENHLVILDDLVLEKNQQSIIDYYIRARKLNVSIVYLSQSYYAIPKVIRQNCNYFIILKMSNIRNTNLILSEFNLGVDKQKLLKIYNYCTKQKFHFLLIDVDADEKERFRCNFTNILDIRKF